MAVVAKLYPLSGPMFTLAMVRFSPVMVNVFGPSGVPTQVAPKAVRAVAVSVVGGAAAVVKLCCVPYAVPPPLVAKAL